MSQEILFMALFTVWNTLMLLGVLRVSSGAKKAPRVVRAPRKASTEATDLTKVRKVRGPTRKKPTI